MDFDHLVKQESIDLFGRNLSDGNLDVLIEVLRTSDVLECLWLACNQITLEDGRLAEAIARSRSLRVLVLNSNQIADEGAKRLAAALRGNRTLQEVALNFNRIGDGGAENLAAALTVNKSLKTMALSGNRIGDEGARSLAVSFKINRTLRKVHLSGNGITDKGAQKLVEALDKNITIDELSLGGDLTSSAVRCRIRAILKDKQRIRWQKIMKKVAKRLSRNAHRPMHTAITPIQSR